MRTLMFAARVAFSHIFIRNRLRGGLATLGVMIGVGSIIVLVSIVEGARESYLQRLEVEGTNVATITAQSATVMGVRLGYEATASLTTEDAEDLKRSVFLIEEVCVRRRDPSQVAFRNANLQAPILSVSPSCFSLYGWSFALGGPFTAADMEGGAQVAVLGHTVSESLFLPEEDPIGSLIRIRNVPFRVIGVLHPKGSTADGFDLDNLIYVPFSTAQRRLFRVMLPNAVETIHLRARHTDDLTPVLEEVRNHLRLRHGLRAEQPDDFMIRYSHELANAYQGTSRDLMILLVAVGSFALVVGGTGIMNILLVSVTERTREIGVRMAVGAKRRHILMQFLIEAMTLSVVGGALGILLGAAGARLITVIAGWPTIISGNTVAAAVLFSLAVGLFFGLYPANKAARLNPIDALRYE
jgi:putative ABC transport system permease protein